MFDRGIPFGIPSYQVDGTDILAVRDVASEAIRRARAGRGPTLIEARMYLHCGHMEGEEVITGKYRSAEETTSWEVRDPIIQFGSRLITAGVCDQADLEQVREEENQRVEESLRFALESEPPGLEELTMHLFAEEVNS